MFDEGALVRGGSEVLYIEPSEVDNDSDLGVFEDHARPFTSGSTLLNAKSGSLDKVLADLRQQYNENEDISFRTEIDRYISRLNDIKEVRGGRGFLRGRIIGARRFAGHISDFETGNYQLFDGRL